MRYPLRQAVPLNLAVSGITIAAALLIRSRTLSLAAVGPWQTAILAISGGAVITAALGPSLARRLPPHRVEGLIIGILMAIGGLLLGEGLFPQAAMQVFPRDGGGAILSGVGMGLLVGLVSSLLGVAGGELIIPTLIFGFGADIKTAGTASLLISLPTVLVGIVRYRDQGAFVDRRPLWDTVLPMGLGSVIGAMVGGLLVGVLPITILKFGLGCILILSAGRMWTHRVAEPVVTEPDGTTTSRD